MLDRYIVLSSKSLQQTLSNAETTSKICSRVRKTSILLTRTVVAHSAGGEWCHCTLRSRDQAWNAGDRRQNLNTRCLQKQILHFSTPKRYMTSKRSRIKKKRVVWHCPCHVAYNWCCNLACSWEPLCRASQRESETATFYLWVLHWWRHFYWRNTSRTDNQAVSDFKCNQMTLCQEPLWPCASVSPSATLIQLA